MDTNVGYVEWLLAMALSLTYQGFILLRCWQRWQLLPRMNRGHRSFLFSDGHHPDFQPLIPLPVFLGVDSSYMAGNILGTSRTLGDWM